MQSKKGTKEEFGRKGYHQDQRTFNRKNAKVFNIVFHNYPLFA